LSWNFEEAWSEMGPEAYLLSPLAALYGLGWLAYKAVYDLGLKTPQEPHPSVVCIGGMVAGGAGKTPVTRHVAETLMDMGRRPVIGMSGYRSQRRKPAYLAPPGPLDPEEWGDETALMRWLLPDVPLVNGKDRVLAARLAREAYPDRVLVMDDGFQHLPIKKHVQILLDPPALGNRMTIPAGPYREVRFLGLKRADLVLPNDEFSIWTRHPRFLRQGVDETTAPREVQVVCAIARPMRLLYALDHIGVLAVAARKLPDHARLDGPQLLAGFDPSIPIVVTAKDWVKLRERKDVDEWTFLVAMHEVTIEPAASFREWLSSQVP
jgi:tetraacyldisaccharide 4'-kinase